MVPSVAANDKGTIVMRLPARLRLTHYGTGSPWSARRFKDRPDLEAGETELSLILGKVDAAAASVLVTKLLFPDAFRRVTTVGALRNEGFRLEHSPTMGNRLHVSVYVPDGAEWDGDVAARFDARFPEEEGRVELRNE
jgi:hypothetical protein